jgi:hypothetical protein
MKITMNQNVKYMMIDKNVASHYNKGEKPQIIIEGIKDFNIGNGDK